MLFIIPSLSDAVSPSAEVSVLARHKRARFMCKCELAPLKLGDGSRTVAARADAHAHLPKSSLSFSVLSEPWKRNLARWHVSAVYSGFTEVFHYRLWELEELGIHHASAGLLPERRLICSMRKSLLS